MPEIRRGALRRSSDSSARPDGVRFSARPSGRRRTAVLEHRGEERGAERAGEVRAALGPVGAGADERAAGVQRRRVDAERVDVVLVRLGRDDERAVALLQRAAGEQAVGERDPGAAGEMVVTRARLAQRRAGR